MKKWNILDIVQIVVALIVLTMTITNSSTPSTYAYFPSFIVEFFLGLMFAIMAINHLIKGQKKSAIFYFFLMIVIFYASFSIYVR